MNISYKNKKVQKQCTSLKYAKKHFSEKIVNKLFKLIEFIRAADSLEAIINFGPINFHDLKGKRDGQYALDIDGRKSSYRLIVSFENLSKDDVFSKSISINEVLVMEVSKHYEQ